MNALWSYFWPVFGAGLLAGVVAGSFAFRRRTKRLVLLASGVAASILLAALWNGPLGGADRFETTVQADIQKTLAYYEMTRVTGHLHGNPLTRRVLLSGPADDFQRQGLVGFMNQIPGVSGTSWSSDGGGTPLIAEGFAIALLGFLFGLLLAYLVELRRRYNAQWNW